MPMNDFRNGLLDCVDIYKINRNFSNRTSKNKMANSEEADMTGIPCRIIREEKVLFEAGIHLGTGDVLKDVKTNQEYTIMNDGYAVKGMDTIHHKTYRVEKKRI
jgi:hypothetical protein